MFSERFSGFFEYVVKDTLQGGIEIAVIKQDRHWLHQIDFPLKMQPIKKKHHKNPVIVVNDVELFGI